MNIICPHCGERYTPPGDQAEVARRYRERLKQRIGIDAYRAKIRMQVARSRRRSSHRVQP